MTARSETSFRGVAAITLSAVLFAVVFLLSGVVETTGEVAFGWRMVITVACYAVALAHPTPRALLHDFWRLLTSTRWMPLVFLLLCAIIGVQLWLFSWAPQNGHALDASLGFLLMPITIVLGGRFVLHSHVTRAQWIAVAIAAIAVAVKIALTPHVSWVTFTICLGYPAYFMIRRRAGLDNPMAFGAEVAVLTPFAFFFIFTADQQPPNLLAFLALLAIGIAGAGAMASYLAAARLLSIPLFGLLGYLELVLLVAVSFMLGERMDAGDLVTYGLLVVALALLAADGFRAARGWGSGGPATGAPSA